LLVVAILSVMAGSFGCSTAQDYQAAQNGNLQSQNLWPTDREMRAGEPSSPLREWFGR
jgi:hypothetical protein